jgi:hypothetical protein
VSNFHAVRVAIKASLSGDLQRSRPAPSVVITPAG